MGGLMKYYAVKKGRECGIYTSWQDCEPLVKGYEGAIFKSFSTRDEALAFLGEKSESDSSFEKPTAYVDGSYNKETEEYSFGAILFLDDGKHIFSKKFGPDDYSSTRNVAGEVRGASFIINYAIKHDIKELDLYYDYQGIESWYKGEWKTNTELTQKYREFALKNNGVIKVNFHKVKSHTGIKYNEEVDLLAKQALGIKN